MRPFRTEPVRTSLTSKSRLTGMLSVSLVAGLTLACAAPVVGGDIQTATAAAPAVKNGTFNTGVADWRTNSSEQILRHTTNGRTGGAAELSTKSKVGGVVLNDVKPTVTNAPTGKSYTVTAWVRAAKPGLGGHLRVRATDKKATDTHKQYFYLGTNQWTKVSFTFTNQRADAKFDLNVLAYSLGADDKFYVDDVTLLEGQSSSGEQLPPAGSVDPKPEAPNVDGYLTNNGTYSKIGVPSKGAYFGAAVGGNTDPAVFERETGAKLGIRRTFYGPSNVNSAVKIAAGDIANNRLPWMSFKLPYSWKEMAAGKGDAWTKDLVAKLDALNGPVWLAFHHEPEGDAPIEDWVAMQKHLSPLVKKNSDNIAYTTILTGWNQLYGNAKYSLENTWPGDGLVDVIGFDVYNFQDTVKNGKTQPAVDIDERYFRHFEAFAKKHNVDWAIAETGINDIASKNDPSWMDRTYKQLVNRGGIGMSYFNTPLNSSTTWAITDKVKTKQFADVLKTSPKMK